MALFNTVLREKTVLASIRKKVFLTKGMDSCRVLNLRPLIEMIHSCQQWCIWSDHSTLYVREMKEIDVEDGTRGMEWR